MTELKVKRLSSTQLSLKPKMDIYTHSVIMGPKKVMLIKAACSLVMECSLQLGRHQIPVAHAVSDSKEQWVA